MKPKKIVQTKQRSTTKRSHLLGAHVTKRNKLEIRHLRLKNSTTFHSDISDLKKLGGSFGALVNNRSLFHFFSVCLGNHKDLLGFASPLLQLMRMQAGNWRRLLSLVVVSCLILDYIYTVGWFASHISWLFFMYNLYATEYHAGHLITFFLRHVRFLCKQNFCLWDESDSDGDAWWIVLDVPRDSIRLTYFVLFGNICVHVSIVSVLLKYLIFGPNNLSLFDYVQGCNNCDALLILEPIRCECKFSFFVFFCVVIFVVTTMRKRIVKVVAPSLYLPRSWGIKKH